MPKKEIKSIPESGKIPVGTRVEILRPNMWAGWKGEVVGCTLEAVHHPRVLGHHVVRIGEDHSVFYAAVKFEELRLSDTR